MVGEVAKAALVEPLLVGVGVIVLTVPIHGSCVVGIVRFVRRERGLGVAGRRFVDNLFVISVAVMIAFAAHLLEMGLWALAYLACGEFHDFATAFYYAAVHYTTLGVGGIVLSPHWRLLGPLAAADGMLTFGLTTATVFTVMFRLVQTRLHISQW